MKSRGRNYYWSRRDDELPNIKKRRRVRLIKLQALLLLIRSRPCVDCAQEYEPWLMEFDHVRGEKRENVSQLVSGTTVSLRVVLQEVRKCDIVCVLCHRKRTAKAFHSNLTHSLDYLRENRKELENLLAKHGEFIGV